MFILALLLALLWAPVANASYDAVLGSSAVGTSGGAIPLLNGTNTWSGSQTFGKTVGTVSTQSGTTYTLAATDCGTVINFTSATAVTLTTLSTLPVGCHIVVRQGAAGQVTVVDGASTTHVSASNFTKTRVQNSKIGLSVIVTTVVDIDGDGI